MSPYDRSGFLSPVVLKRANHLTQYHGTPRSRQYLSMHQITFEHKGNTYTFEAGEHTSVLEAALDNGIDLPHDCKLGVCLTCPSKIVSGKSDQDGTTLEDSVTSQGYALTCCVFPRSDMVMKSIDEDELVSAQFEKF